jgi:biopolymer transport protein ExbD
MAINQNIMAEIIQKNSTRKYPKLDMTPMVDLAFLLLTFFVLAASLSKPRAMEIIYPKEAEVPQEIGPNTITILLPENEGGISYYLGKFENNPDKLIKLDGTTDLRKILFNFNESILEKLHTLENLYSNKELSAESFQAQRKLLTGSDEAPTAVIKTQDKSKFQTVVNVLDELNICSMRKRVIQDMSESEKELLWNAD